MPVDPTVPECTYTQFGCCPDNKTLPSPGPENRGCPCKFIIHMYVSAFFLNLPVPCLNVKVCTVYDKPLPK